MVDAIDLGLTKSKVRIPLQHWGGPLACPDCLGEATCECSGVPATLYPTVLGQAVPRFGMPEL
jgi:hypothetical protein